MYFFFFEKIKMIYITKKCFHSRKARKRKKRHEYLQNYSAIGDKRAPIKEKQLQENTHAK